jgi:Xylose isomerase-like TIM barrel
MPPIGFSTGALALGDFKRALTMLVMKSAEAVELSALRSVELPRLLNALSSLNLTRYRYTAIHAPTDAPNERELVERLEEVANRGFNVVVHPDTIHEFPLWERLNGRLCIENMDSRKSTGRTADELRTIFRRLPEARLCFDIAHARQVDPTMTEATRILFEFGNRLAQVHLSEVDGKGRHFAISFVAKLAYRPLAEILSKVPVILESPVGECDIESEIREAHSVLDDQVQQHAGRVLH